MSMFPSCPLAGGVGRPGLRHVDNPSAPGHFDTDTPTPQPWEALPRAQCAPRRTSPDIKDRPRNCDMPINTPARVYDKAVIDCFSDPLNASGGSDANGETAPVRCSV
ncbi:hypothetical protein D9M72_553420 [compost metagenome]